MNLLLFRVLLDMSVVFRQLSDHQRSTRCDSRAFDIINALPSEDTVEYLKILAKVCDILQKTA